MNTTTLDMIKPEDRESVPGSYIIGRYTDPENPIFFFEKKPKAMRIGAECTTVKGMPSADLVVGFFLPEHTVFLDLCCVLDVPENTALGTLEDAINKLATEGRSMKVEGEQSAPKSLAIQTRDLFLEEAKAAGKEIPEQDRAYKGMNSLIRVFDHIDHLNARNGLRHPTLKFGLEAVLTHAANELKIKFK